MGRAPSIGQGTVRKAQNQPVALDVKGNSIRSLALDHQLTVWSNWKSGSGWSSGSSSGSASSSQQGNPDDFTTGRGPQGDAIRIYNYIRLVRDAG